MTCRSMVKTAPDETVVKTAFWAKQSENEMPVKRNLPLGRTVCSGPNVHTFGF